MSSITEGIKLKCKNILDTLNKRNKIKYWVQKLLKKMIRFKFSEVNPFHK